MTDTADQPTPESLSAALTDLLTVEQTDEDRYFGKPRIDGFGRVFGGQVIAQALQCAQDSISPEDGGATKIAHSLHAYFLRGGVEGVPIHYRIARDFDGRSFANRRVVASQENEHGELKPILNLTASFQVPEDGLEHDDAPMPDVPGPEDLPSELEERRTIVEEKGHRMSEERRKLMLRPRPIEMRNVDQRHWMNSDPQPPYTHSWFRCAGQLNDDPALHRAVIAYASDFTLLGTSALPHGLSWMRGEIVGASLDHALWFHRPARADEWLLYATDAPWSGSGRGFNRGRIFNQKGELIASVAQEGMMRHRKRKPKE